MLALLSGCGAPALEVAAEDPAPLLRAQAEAALRRYDVAVEAAGGSQRFVPVGDQTGVIGEFEPAFGDNAKMALGNGYLEATGPLPGPPATAGEVVWENGTREKVELLSAETALARIGRAECPECTPLKITGARLGSARVDTTRGPASAPVWEYTIKGTSARLTRPAADGTVRMVPPSWNPDDPPGGPALDSASTAIGSRELTVAFIGAPGTAAEPCGADYTGAAVESASAVVVYVLAEHHRGPAGENVVCPAIGASRTVTVTLTEPLGDRAVLEVQQGTPVAVAITP
ncbi:hypothetical protein [Actinoplanes derwentensis]|uniref:Uncharacterized protein n=1 Tax=Actinoplanes derwentensis TaxID=113562 RepID=A0A1H2D973_9ACTN|nr:hypothetical protein [Actinoplanes derwentensis]GID81541.1 hypothetical protein Ade03nite_04650 [Actinoplanes derwentensis]SDT79261.1 hypothetical protein SAMN04489716_8713 [Actinoplanes derwentensis]